MNMEKRLIPGFNVGGESEASIELSNHIAGLAGEIAIAFNMNGSSAEADLRQDPLVSLTARVAASLLLNTGKVRAEDLIWKEEDYIMGDLVVDETSEMAIKAHTERSAKWAYYVSYRLLFNAEPGDKYIYPTADDENIVTSELVNKEADRLLADSSLHGQAERRNHIKNELWHDSRFSEVAKKRVLLSKILGCIELLAKDEQPAEVIVPSQTSPNWAKEMSEIIRERFSDADDD